MLDSLRAFSKTTIAKLFFAVLIVSFAAFGINNVITTLGSSTVARVGGQEITVRDFQHAYQQQLNAAARQFGRVPTSEEAMALGVPSQTLGRLTADAALNQLADDMGIGVSDDKLGEMVRADFGGSFSRDNFRQALAQNGLSEDDYIKAQTGSARRQQLVLAVFGDAEPPATAMNLISRYMGDTRSVDYFVLNATSIPPVAAPTEDELAQYLKDHQADFRTEETRSVDILTLSPEVLAAGKTFTDAEIEAEYERTKQNLTKPETRHIVQVVLPDAAAVKTFTDGQAAGESFDELVQAAGLTTTDLGTLSKSQVTDPRLADAAFGLAKTGDFTVIPGAIGQRAVSVTEIEGGGTIPLAEAKDKVRQNLALAQARNEYGDVLDQIEELRAAFKPLTEIAQRFNLKPIHVDLTSSGDALSAVSDIAATDRAKVTDAIFKAEPGKLAASIALTSNHTVWFDLKQVDAARDQTLAEVHDAVATAWTDEKTEAALDAEAKKLEGQLASGAAIADLAAADNQLPQISQPMTRRGDGTPVFSTAVAQEIFNGGPDHSGAVKDSDGDYVVFKVNQVTPASGDLQPQLKATLESTARDSLYAAFVGGVRDETGVHVNQQALEQVLDLSGVPQ
jgi:peptidyl-prolyl cis-trans isomerase D